VGACTTSSSGRVYTDKGALQAEDVEEGIVESVELATIRKDGTIIGTAGGTVLGAIAGNTIGGGTGKQLASVGGAIIGGLLGHYFEQGVTDKNALKIVVKLASGEKIVIIQEDDVPFQKGEKVNIFSSRNDNTKRVSKF
jgi:outer membrane lipoprotein SlyB